MSETDFPPGPPLKGEVCIQYIRCNKPGCRCREGQTHGPYYYRVWREAGRVRKEYVKSENLAATRASCEAYRALQGRLRELRQQREMLARDIEREWHKTRRLLRHTTLPPGSSVSGVSAGAAPPTPPRTGP